ncbi:hypothetical protein BO99DRAFT_58980 [Aspergillus violaceofuscus CBS 115571]|uniref:Uncharacterized protein n=1 Tax=Aspergillus violaceofuscus (strain CBS 115571) TaxID=1450538 RepID=A0A2V5GR04_ASPV1|nr:hypothetical protein BO99DRAFT_58980 [Aspergillus violaceofuscus CBS 115571]
MISSAAGNYTSSESRPGRASGYLTTIIIVVLVSVVGIASLFDGAFPGKARFSSFRMYDVGVDVDVDVDAWIAMTADILGKSHWDGMSFVCILGSVRGERMSVDGVQCPHTLWPLTCSLVQLDPRYRHRSEPAVLVCPHPVRSASLTVRFRV